MATTRTNLMAISVLCQRWSLHLEEGLTTAKIVEASTPSLGHARIVIRLGLAIMADQAAVANQVMVAEEEEGLTTRKIAEALTPSLGHAKIVIRLGLAIRLHLAIRADQAVEVNQVMVADHGSRLLDLAALTKLPRLRENRNLG